MIRIHKLYFSAKGSFVERDMVKRRRLTSFYCFISLDVNSVGLKGNAGLIHEGHSPLGGLPLHAHSLKPLSAGSLQSEKPGPVHDMSMFPAGVDSANFAVIFLHRLLTGSYAHHRKPQHRVGNGSKKCLRLPFCLFYLVIKAAAGIART